MGGLRSGDEAEPQYVICAAKNQSRHEALMTVEGLAAVSWITCDNCTCFATMFNSVGRMMLEVPVRELMESGTLTSELPCGGRCVLGLREEHSQLMPNYALN